MKQFFFISIYYFLLLSNVNLFAISTQILPSDSIIRKPSSTIIKYSHPRIPTIMSAILPGLGQLHNKKLFIYYLFKVMISNNQFARRHLVLSSGRLL